MKYQYIMFLLTFSLLLSSCGFISGLQTYDLPRHGGYTTPEGAKISIIQLNQGNIPPPKPFGAHDDTEIVKLFNQPQPAYTLTSGDVLSIQLWAYPEITQNSSDLKSAGYTIDPSGNILLPLVGQLHIAAKTLPEANQYIRQQFSRYLKHPDVVVRITSYEGRKYYVNGQVSKSGQYTLNDHPISVYTALSMAGGVNMQTGDSSNIQLIRQGLTYNLNLISLEKRGLSLHRLYLHPEDTLYINTKQEQKLYVMGESSRNQALSLRDQGMSLSDVLGESEGINPFSASAARIFIMRTDLKNQTSIIYQVNLSSIANLALANQFQMQKNDIVYIDATGLTRWQRVLSQIIPFSNAIYSFGQFGQLGK